MKFDLADLKFLSTRTSNLSEKISGCAAFPQLPPKTTCNRTSESSNRRVLLLSICAFDVFLHEAQRRRLAGAEKK